MNNEPKNTDVAQTQTETKPASSLLTKAGIALLFLSMNPSADQPATALPSFDIIVIGGTNAEVDELALTQRCSQCEAAVVLHIELEQKKTGQ